MTRRVLSALFLGILALPLPARAQRPAWVGSWGTSVQLTEPRNLPPAPGLAGSTLRQLVHLSLGGTRLRVRFSNAFGTSDVVLGSAHVARAAGGSAIRAGSDRPLLFGGKASVTIPPGQSVLSDALPYELAPLADLALTVRIDSASSVLVTGHPGSRAGSYLQAGDLVSADSMPGAVRVEHWYLIAGIDVLPRAPSAVVAVLGNSITDGRGSTTDGNNRWPDELARRLLADKRTARVGVLNEGIGGNCVLRDCLGPAALARLDRDVLEQAGVRWLIVLEGVNDIGGARGPAASDSVAANLIAAYREIVARAHARHIRVYGATIMPFGTSFYDSPEHEKARQAVNAWIRTGGAFDAVIDLDAATRDPGQPARLQAVADSGDHLHPSVAGHRMMAESVDLGLFSR